jgi:hypothetical protein
MRKSIVVLVAACMLPVAAFAQAQPAEPAADNGSFTKTLAITGGVVGGLVIADLLTGGALTAPLLRAVGLRAAAPAAAAVARAPLTPAVAEARAAGAVLGEQITGATEVRDAAARSDLAYVGILGGGALIGGWLISHLVGN